LHNPEKWFHLARFEGFSGTLPLLQRSGKQMQYKSAIARVLPLQRSETLQNRKRL
jgi:hypothetical protein